jgi:hypothetical protein
MLVTSWVHVYVPVLFTTLHLQPFSTHKTCCITLGTLPFLTSSYTEYEQRVKFTASIKSTARRYLRCRKWGVIGDLSGSTDRRFPDEPCRLLCPAPFGGRASVTKATTTINKITHATIDVWETPWRRQDIPMLLSVRVTELAAQPPPPTPKLQRVFGMFHRWTAAHWQAKPKF